ncbi:MAG: MFS transporter [Lacibacter sp.]
MPTLLFTKAQAVLKTITKTVWVLSLVSFLTDTASELLYPVMPFYLKSIGFSVLLIGMLEGVAEATAGLSKGYFGQQSDRLGRRVPFVQLGYALSAVSKPLMALLTAPLWVFFARTLDRLGKGVRTGARDALLSAAATPQTKGTVFGFHRSMDTLGAVLGPTLALLYLHYHPNDYKTLFLIAFAPGALAVLATLVLKEQQAPAVKASQQRLTFFSFLRYWQQSTPAYRKLVTGLLLFTLCNSSDVFLLLQARQAGLNDTLVIGIYIFYNLVYAVFAFPLGALADRLGLKTVFVAGLVLFAVVYLGMAFSTGTAGFFVLFFLYGIYAAATEGISKAWITNVAAAGEAATAVGTFTALQSVGALLASSITGLLWYRLGAAVALSTAAAGALLVVLYFTRVPAPEAVHRQNR